MNLYHRQFLAIEGQASFEKANVVILPFGFEGAISYGSGAAAGPDAILEASAQVELFDEQLGLEPVEIGLCTVTPPVIPAMPEAAVDALARWTEQILKAGKFPVVIGGDHSITTGFYQALCSRFGKMSVIQFDAHADLRETYGESRFSHACTMARIREVTEHTLQLGIRSMCLEEAQRIDDEDLSVFSVRDIRDPGFDVKSELACLPDPVFITLDVDVFDWSVIRSTGTPEPGGLMWDETLDILGEIFRQKNVVGFDVVELCGDSRDINSAFAAAKLIYKMIGMKFYGA